VDFMRNHDEFSNDSEEGKYGLNLKRFTSHEKVFPWRFIVKVIIGLALVGFVYYITSELVEKQKRETLPKTEDGIEITITED
jgi:hypothetical protein